MDLNKDQATRARYHLRLFWVLLGFSWLLVACFVAFQYNREKQYKAERLDERLQLFNLRLLDAIKEDYSPDSVVKSNLPVDNLRVTVIDFSGKVAYDNSLSRLPESNHIDRPEVKEAMAHGTGYTIRRHSDTTNDSYFYSAMASDSLIVRSAVPYGMSLSEMLEADSTFLWYMLAVSLIVSVLGWIATRRISDAIAARLLLEEQEKTRIKRQLTNNINHELKTPLSAMQICIETLLEHPELDSGRQREILQRADANNRRLKSLMADVATLTRLDEGRETVAKEPLVLNEVIREVAAEFPPDMYLPIIVNMPV